MSEPQAAEKRRDPNRCEAAAPFHAACVTGPAGSLPPRWFAPLREFSARDNWKGDANHGHR